MSATRPLLTLLAFFTLLLSVPLAAEASSGDKTSSHRHSHKAAAHHKKHKKHKKHRRHKTKKHRPHTSTPAAQHTTGAPGADGAATDDRPIGVVSAVSGDTVTVGLKDGTSLTGLVTDDTDMSCPDTGTDDSADDTADDTSSDDASDDSGDDDSDEADFRSLASDEGCAIAVGAPVYAASVIDGAWDVLDLEGE